MGGLCWLISWGRGAGDRLGIGFRLGFSMYASEEVVKYFV